VVPLAEPEDVGPAESGVFVSTNDDPQVHSRSRRSKIIYRVMQTTSWQRVSTPRKALRRGPAGSPGARSRDHRHRVANAHSPRNDLWARCEEMCSDL
jgi:hypothetical protein